MKKFNLLPQTILVIIAFIAFSFTTKNNIDVEKKQQTAMVTTSVYTNTVSILYENGLTPLEKTQARQCFISYLNVAITQVTECDGNENLEILTLSMLVQFPTVGMNGPEDHNEQLPPGSTMNYISFDQVVNAVNACPNVIVVSPGTSACNKSPLGGR